VAEFIFPWMAQAPPQTFRFSAATGMHRGDRAYQQDQVEIIVLPRSKRAVLAVVADGMGG
jgi:serine/threonine protein phosphatase PrpC